MGLKCVLDRTLHSHSHEISVKQSQFQSRKKSIEKKILISHSSVLLQHICGRKNIRLTSLQPIVAL